MSDNVNADSTNAIITYGEDVGDGSDEWGKYVCCSINIWVTGYIFVIYTT